MQQSEGAAAAALAAGAKLLVLMVEFGQNVQREASDQNRISMKEAERKIKGV